ncbi:MAG: DUF2956 domain-containing protein [endosymbiont of Galathealinum brachiosum]|uniref:DUF2956 domain-containing protein n=1 Tax=endosymbiont of Galathealinum brachiosum TaxID=2200906 RepID=A0A370DIM9_9GAMM|nr:MAG: DUF2956 domain-containing protein [endosymbiont of Galathealinum brachiosum]
MAKHSKKNKISEQTKEDATKIALGTQRPGQTREQTKLITQGIQKGIEQYKKKHKEKARELDKKLKKVSTSKPLPEPTIENTVGPSTVKHNKLPWILLILSWIGFFVYFVTGK